MLSVVSTLYHSENFVEPFCKRVQAVLSEMGIADYELILVNDGSPDGSLQKALHLRAADPRIRVADLSRNFGHHQAIRTGLQLCRGDLVFLIDSDLEEPPELLSTYFQHLHTEKHTWDVVYGVQGSRKGRAFERVSGKIFYKMLRRISGVNYPADSLTARLMTRPYLEAVLSFPERDLELWSIFLLAGFRQKPVVSVKADKGSSAYTFTKKLRMAFHTLTSLTDKPLYWIFFTGLFLVLGSVVLWLVLLFSFLFIQVWWYSGRWLTLSVIIWVGGMIMCSIGMVGIYLARVLREVQQRPAGIIRHFYT